MRVKKQSYCSSHCAADMQAAARSSKMRGEGQPRAFQTFRERGGAAFVEAIHVYRAECSSTGRGHSRPQFDFVRYLVVIECNSKVEKGTRIVWLNKSMFVKHEADSGTCAASAAAEFELQ